MGILEKLTDALGLVYFGRDKAVEKKEPSNHALEDYRADMRAEELRKRDLEDYRKANGLSVEMDNRTPSWLATAREDEEADRRAEQRALAKTKEVMVNIAPEQAKTLLQSDAHHALSLNPKERKEHYKNVQEKHGQKALEKLLAEVRKQRTKSNALEM